MKAKEEKQLVLVNDRPYIYLDYSFLNGNIEEVSKNILNIKNLLKEAYNQREKEFNVKNYTNNFTSFKDYKNIELLVSDYGDGIEIDVRVYREETDEELTKRLNQEKTRKLAAKKAAETRKLAQEKKEKTLLENLKKKYGERG